MGKVLVANLFLLLLASASGHGYLKSPRPRQLVAAEEGIQNPSDPNADSLPKKEFCPHCSLVGGQTYGVCGRTTVNTPDYTFDYKTLSGLPMPWESQLTVEEGGLITVESVLQTNHGGHIVVGVCSDYINPTQACFDSNQLELVEDPLYGGPKDPNYPERGYLAPQTNSAQTSPEFSPLVSIQDSVNVGGQLTRHIFRLPMGVYGEKVLFQWHWVSNLGCRSPGYDQYPWPAGWEPYGNADDVCALPMPDIGNLPQQYWQCSEITITQAGPVEPTPPTPPTTPMPVAPPTSPAPVACDIIADGCCSISMEQGCVTWDSPCFTFENCGKTQECRWSSEMHWMGCQDEGPAPSPTNPQPTPTNPQPTPTNPQPTNPAPTYFPTNYPTYAPIPPVGDGCDLQTEGCCYVDAQQGCPDWTSPCFTFENCGKTQECSWNPDMKWVCPEVDDEPEGCCAQHGQCLTYSNPCLTYENCGVDDPSRGIHCSWGGSLQWVDNP